MRYRGFHHLLSLSLICSAGAVTAQMPSLPGGTSGMPGAMPDVSSMGMGNAAGVLGYCVKNKFLGGSEATSVLGSLTKKPDVQSSDGYKAGQTGQLQTGKGSPLSLDSIPKSMKSKVCGMVLKQAKSFI